MTSFALPHANPPVSRFLFFAFETRVRTFCELSANSCSEKLHLQYYLEMIWSETRCFGLLGNDIILVIILLDLIER